MSVAGKHLNSPAFSFLSVFSCRIYVHTLDHICLSCGFKQKEKGKYKKQRRVCIVLSGGILVSAVVFTHIGQLIIDAEVLRGYSDAERGFSLRASSADEQSTQSRLQRIPLKLPGLLWKSLLQLKCYFF